MSIQVANRRSASIQNGGVLKPRPPGPPRPHRFSVADYYQMAEMGILARDERVELIEGEIIRMSPIGSRHAACVDCLSDLIRDQLGRSVIVRVQNPVRLDEFSEPEPDISVLRRRSDYYRRRHPLPEDVLLIVEVSDTTFEFDRDVKLPLYAQAGIPEVWLVHLDKNVIEVHSQPVNGSYKTVRRCKRRQDVVSATISKLTLGVNAILG